MPVPISKPNFCYNRNFSIPVAVTMTLDWVSRTDTICWFSLSLSLPKSLECYKKGGLQEGKTGADLDCAAGQAVIGHSCPKRLPLGKKHHHWWGPRVDAPMASGGWQVPAASPSAPSSQRLGMHPIVLPPQL